MAATSTAATEARTSAPKSTSLSIAPSGLGCRLLDGPLELYLRDQPLTNPWAERVFIPDVALLAYLLTRIVREGAAEDWTLRQGSRLLVRARAALRWVRAR